MRSQPKVVNNVRHVVAVSIVTMLGIICQYAKTHRFDVGKFNPLTIGVRHWFPAHRYAGEAKTIAKNKISFYWLLQWPGALGARFRW